MISVHVAPVRPELRGQLIELRESLTRRLDRLKSDRRREADSLSADSVDRAVQCAHDDVVDSIAASTAGELRQVLDALHRFDEGLYGRCQDCGAPIETGRLKALPYTSHCQLCAPGHTATGVMRCAR